jgi:adenylate kinase family enzyme
LGRPHLIIVGYPGSGKTSLARSVAAETGAYTVEIGRFVVDEAKKLNSGITPLEYADNTFQARDFLRFVNYALKEVRDHHDGCVVVGPRLIQEVNYLRAHLRDVICIGLNVPATIREQRRINELLSYSFSQQAQAQMRALFKHRDDVERSWGLDRTILECDYRLDEASSMDSLVQKVLAIWKEGLS